MYFYHTTSLDYKLLKAGVFYGSSINMLTMLDKIKLFSIQQNFRTLATISTLLIFSIQPAYYYIKPMLGIVFHIYKPLRKLATVKVFTC